MGYFNTLVEQILNEITAGGVGSAFGAGVVSTATQFSADNYAKGDARTPRVIGGKVIKRNMPKDSIFLGKKTKHRKHHKRRKK